MNDLTQSYSGESQVGVEEFFQRRECRKNSSAGSVRFHQREVAYRVPTCYGAAGAGVMIPFSVTLSLVVLSPEILFSCKEFPKLLSLPVKTVSSQEPS